MNKLAATFAKPAAVTLVGLIVAVYAVAWLSSFVSKGWRSPQNYAIAVDIADSLRTPLPNARVDVAQEYYDGCSLIAFDVYLKRCFSVRVSVAENSISMGDVQPILEHAARQAILNAKKASDTERGRSIKLGIRVQSVALHTEQGGLKRYDKSDLVFVQLEDHNANTDN